MSISNVDELVKIHFDARDILVIKGLSGFNEFLMKYINKESTAGELKTLLIISKGFRDDPIVKTNVSIIKERLESITGREEK